MADFNKAFELLGKGIEWNSCSNIFRFNKGETDPTFAGIYLKYFKNTRLYEYLKEKIKANFKIDLDNYFDKEKLKKDKKLQEKISFALCVDDTALNLAKQIYHKQFWSKIKGDSIKNQQIANLLFGQAVNIGVYNAVKILQKCLNVKQDGIIGKITLGAVNKADTAELIECLKREFKNYYCDLVAKKPYLALNLAGWNNRIDRLLYS